MNRLTSGLLETLDKLDSDVRKIKAKLRSHSHGHKLPGIQSDGLVENSTGWNITNFVDLDFVGDPSGGPEGQGPAMSRGVSVTLETGSQVIVMISAHILEPQNGGQVFMGYRVSGPNPDHTRATEGNRSLRNAIGSINTNLSGTYVELRTGLEPGTNTFELQVRQQTGLAEGQLWVPSITVIPL